MASVLAQINDGLTNIGRDFGKLFGEQRGSGADTLDAIKRGTDEDKKKFFEGQYGNNFEVGKSLEQQYQENLTKRTAEARDQQIKENNVNVLKSKKTSSAGQASGRQGTTSGVSSVGGSLLGGGSASIGSKTLLGQ